MGRRAPGRAEGSGPAADTQAAGPAYSPELSTKRRVVGLPVKATLLAATLPVTKRTRPWRPRPSPCRHGPLIEHEFVDHRSLFGPMTAPDRAAVDVFLAQLTACTALANSIRKPSPMDLKSRPACLAICGSITSVRSASSCASVPASSLPMSFE